MRKMSLLAFLFSAQCSTNLVVLVCNPFCWKPHFHFLFVNSAFDDCCQDKRLLPSPSHTNSNQSFSNSEILGTCIFRCFFQCFLMRIEFWNLSLDISQLFCFKSFSLHITYVRQIGNLETSLIEKIIFGKGHEWTLEICTWMNLIWCGNFD